MQKKKSLSLLASLNLNKKKSDAEKSPLSLSLSLSLSVRFSLLHLRFPRRERNTHTALLLLGVHKTESCCREKILSDPEFFF